MLSLQFSSCFSQAAIALEVLVGQNGTVATQSSWLSTAINCMCSPKERVLTVAASLLEDSWDPPSLSFGLRGSCPTGQTLPLLHQAHGMQSDPVLDFAVVDYRHCIVSIGGFRAEAQGAQTDEVGSLFLNCTTSHDRWGGNNVAECFRHKRKEKVPSHLKTSIIHLSEWWEVPGYSA